MKKLVICLVFLGLLLSCDSNSWNDTVITNSSGYNVTFKFNHTKEDGLLPGGVKTFETKAYQYLESYEPSKRVYFKLISANEGYIGEFLTLPSWVLNITNSLTKDVTLYADGWLEYSGNDTVVIPAGGTETAKIFTNKPVFKAINEDGFPAAVSWEFNELNTNEMLVTIE